MIRRLAAGVSGIAVALTLAATAFAASTPALPSADPFYTYTGSLSHTAAGTVLRTRQIQLADLGITTPVQATQVLYRTTGELGEPTVTVATIIKPLLGLGAPKLVSYQTAYDALGPVCDPSYTLQGGNPSYQTAELEANVMLGYVAAGYTVVTADYEGETLDYGAGQESGYGTLDGIRAAENLLKLAPARTPVGMVGYSGGAIATEYASELAPAYAPELDVTGVAEGGIPVDYAHILNYINGSPQWSGVIPAILVGLARAFHIDMNTYLSPYGKQLTDQVSSECINSFLGAYPGLTIQKLLKPQYQDVFKVPVFLRSFNKMIMSTDGTPKGPLMMANGNADGTGDGVMIANDVEALAHAYCQRHVPVQFTVYNGDSHTVAAIPFEAAALTFMTQRLNGVTVPDGCASIGAGNSLAPLPSAPAPKSPRLEYRYLGPSKRLHAVVFELSTTTGAISGLVVRVWHGRRLIDSVRLARITTHEHRVLLRAHGAMPRAGRYRLTITSGRRTVLERTLRVRLRSR